MRRRLLRPWVLTALVGLVYLLVAPPTTDLAAQVHRTELAQRDVWLVDFSWFGGHHLPSYSVLSPLLGRWLGVLLTGAGAAVIAAWAFERLVILRWPTRGGTIAGWWFAAAVGTLLFTGRITFIVGLAFGLLTVLAAVTGRLPGVSPRLSRGLLGVVGAALTTLASPVAALFLALVGLSWAASVGAWRERIVPLAVTATAFALAGALSLAFPGGGTEPFVASALWPAVAVLLIVALVLPRDERALRIGAVLYLVGILLSAVLPTPMGGNATRLVALAGGPLLLAALWGRRPLALALLALPFVYWQLYPPVRDATQAWGDSSARAAYWQPLADQLRARLHDEPARVEVPPTARRGEARWLAPDVPLARGWIRQLDRYRNPIFYRDRHRRPLTTPDYRRWLHANAIGWIALPDAPADYASRAEVALLRDGRVPGLTRVWSNAHWTLWRVDRARPLVTTVDRGRSRDNVRSPVRIDSVGPDHVSFAGTLPGDFDLRIRWSPYLRVTDGEACLREASDGWTHVRTDAPGRVTVGVGASAPGRRSPSRDCNP